MEDLDFDYKNYWETTMFFQNQELEFDSWPFEEAFSGSGDSSSPDGAATASSSPASSKNVVSERNRRQKLNERLFALRSVVPNISKLDKASVIKDSINYMQQLIDEEKKLEAEIKELESQTQTQTLSQLNPNCDYDYDCVNNFGSLEHQQQNVIRSKKIKQINYNDTFESSVARMHHSPIEVLEMKVTWMGDKTGVICIRCKKKRETMLQLCRVLESLNLNILTTNFTSLSSHLSSTLFLQVDKEERDLVEAKIHRAIAAYNDPNYIINF